MTVGFDWLKGIEHDITYNDWQHSIYHNSYDTDIGMWATQGFEHNRVVYDSHRYAKFLPKNYMGI
jgi:hypothetical protein